jgi:hypothetical protein
VPGALLHGEGTLGAWLWILSALSTVVTSWARTIPTGGVIDGGIWEPAWRTGVTEETFSAKRKIRLSSRITFLLASLGGWASCALSHASQSSLRAVRSRWTHNSVVWLARIDDSVVRGTVETSWALVSALLHWARVSVTDSNDIAPHSLLAVVAAGLAWRVRVLTHGALLLLFLPLLVVVTNSRGLDSAQLRTFRTVVTSWANDRLISTTLTVVTLLTRRAHTNIVSPLEHTVIASVALSGSSSVAPETLGANVTRSEIRWLGSVGTAEAHETTSARVRWVNLCLTQRRAVIIGRARDTI